MSAPHVIVIGAGMGGLAAAFDLAASGTRVTLLERHAGPGGKMRQVDIGGAGVDSGPTVFTMRWVFDDLFAAAGQRFDDHVTLVPSDMLARHSWTDGSRLDLYADVDESVAAIAAFAGAAEGDAYRRFAAQSQRIFETLDLPFMRAQKPNPVALTLSLGLLGVPKLWATRPFTSLWNELGKVFRDPRLRQLFGRYATYCGSSPFQAPATLMLIAHAERAGVWVVKDGMQHLALALAAAASDAGATLRYGAGVRELNVDGGRVTGVTLDDGESIAADAVVFNGDIAALSAGLLGDDARAATLARYSTARSLSAVTLSAVARTSGFDLAHHTVFFGSDYKAEFDRVFGASAIIDDPTIYVCAQDRGPGRTSISSDGERLLCLLNAPARDLTDEEAARCRSLMIDALRRHGLVLEHPQSQAHGHGSGNGHSHGREHERGQGQETGGSGAGGRVFTTPGDFNQLFPASGGALYGRPTHGWTGSFDRPGARAKLRGLYFAGGSVHPGPGVPMTVMSGRLAAQCVRDDLAG